MSAEVRSLVHFFVNHKRTLRRMLLLTSLGTMIGLGGSYARAHNLPIDLNLSGYETFIGIQCTLHGQPGACGVTFSGWIGGDGQTANGWEPFPGDFQGLWKAQINYTGQAGFGNRVNIEGGKWTIFFLDGHSLSGRLTGGSVQWPAQGSNIGCGNDVAIVHVDLRLGGTSVKFDGCLHDLPARTVIPPMVWGEFSAQ
jgi:hypothetical protein